MSSRNDSSSIFGQGATGKIRAEARPVVHGGEEAERLLAAFGAENYESDFDCLRRGVRCATLFHQHCRVGVIKFLHVVALVRYNKSRLGNGRVGLLLSVSDGTK